MRKRNAEFTEGSEIVFIKGRLKRNWYLWMDIGANDYILDTIIYGYKFPLILPPEPIVYNP